MIAKKVILVKLHLSPCSDDAPVLVLGNSLGTSTALWNAHLHWMARHFTVVRFDHPGHGDEGVPSGDVTVQGIATSLHATLARAGITRFSYCGVSLGGAVGLALAATFPNSVEALVVSNSGAALGSRAFWSARMAAVRESGLGSIADATVSRWVGEEKLHGAEGAWLRQMLTETTVEGYLACASAVMQFDGRPLLDHVTARTLVLAGSLDAATPAALGRELASAIPGAAFAEIPCAHIAPVDAPGAFESALATFFRLPRDRE